MHGDPIVALIFETDHHSSTSEHMSASVVMNTVMNRALLRATAGLVPTLGGRPRAQMIQISSE